MKVRTVRALVSVLLLAALVALSTTQALALGGPVILGGDDLTDHGSRSGGVNQLGWLYIEDAVSGLEPLVSRAGPHTSDIAALGSADAACSPPAPPANCTGGNAGRAIGSAAANAGLSVSFVDGAASITTFFADLAAGTVNPKIIWIAGTGAVNDLDGAESTALTTNAASIAAFVASGGGLMAHSTAYGWLETLLPGLSAPGGCTSPGASLTPAGNLALPNVTNADIQAGPCHNTFTGNLGGLEILALDGSTFGSVCVEGSNEGASCPAFGGCPGGTCETGRIFIIGGASVVFCALDPETDFNPLDTDHTVTATVEDNSGVPQAGVFVDFLVDTGPNAGASGMETTNASGEASFTYTGTGGPGRDAIGATFVNPQGVDIACDGEKFWDADCNENGIPDTCDLDCAGFGGDCGTFIDCGMSLDDDGNGVPDECNRDPICDNAFADPDELWPPNHKFREVAALGVVDPDGDPVTITITSISQDEPLNGLGDGDTCPDGTGVGTDTASVRAERSGTKKVPGDGRVYHIDFNADDGQGGSCDGLVTVCVPHDQRPGHVCVDQGPIFDSTVCAP